MCQHRVNTRLQLISTHGQEFSFFPFLETGGGRRCAHSRSVWLHSLCQQSRCLFIHVMHRSCVTGVGGAEGGARSCGKDLERFEHARPRGPWRFQGGPTRTALLGLPAQASDEARDQREQAHRHREQLNECAQAIRALTSLASCAQARRGS